MRLLHLADIHFGKKLDRFDRTEAHAALCRQVVRTAEERDCRLVVIAGDVFDSSSPSAEAERLYFSLLRDLTAAGARAVVVIAGNHDSTRKLAAPAAILRDRGVFVFGDPTDLESQRGGEPFAWRWEKGVLRLEIEGEAVEVVPLPFLSRERLGLTVPPEAEPDEIEKAFQAAVKNETERRAEALGGDVPSVLVTHQHFRETAGDGTERDISAGGIYSLPTALIPADAFDYAAAGHLHVRQPIRGVRNGWYAGSPLAFAFEDPIRERGFLVRDLETGDSEFLRVEDPRPLRRWSYESPEKLEEDLLRPENRKFFLDVELKCGVDAAVLARLRSLHDGVVSLRCVGEKAEETADSDLAGRIDLSAAELFRLMYRQKKGREPSDDLMNVFGEILAREDGDEA